MGLKQDIIIRSQFGSKSPGNYIVNYTSRKNATESLEINNYITKYTTRYEANEKLKQEGGLDEDIAQLEDKHTLKNGVMFGNRGLSYTSSQLRESARRTQKATEEGHVAILQVISFNHDYLKEKGIVDPNMQEPNEKGAYKGRIDQLKLRQGITDMMDKMHGSVAKSEKI
ncbi:relaxase MobL [Staphylococcus massiliensis]|uniref:relaxase MobL n=1 Tax=Staphylococcus massiliensis TaxID=555791 RepID=UPI001EDFA483|nr:relaxase MobL [Staphylococcus massiliensis]MCG3400720.1 relaxase MobL [Staphylococcus massiliensis]